MRKPNAGGGSTSAWSDPANWLDGVVPEVGAAVIFNTDANLATTMDLTDLVVGGITFGPNAGAFTTVGSPLTVQEKIVNASEQPQTFNETLSLGVAGSRVTVDTGAQAITLVGGVGSQSLPEPPHPFLRQQRRVGSPVSECPHVHLQNLRKRHVDARLRADAHGGQRRVAL